LQLGLFFEGGLSCSGGELYLQPTSPPSLESFLFEVRASGDFLDGFDFFFRSRKGWKAPFRDALLLTFGATAVGPLRRDRSEGAWGLTRVFSWSCPRALVAREIGLPNFLSALVIFSPLLAKFF